MFVDKQGRRRTFGQTDAERDVPTLLSRARFELSDAEAATIEVVRRDKRT